MRGLRLVPVAATGWGAAAVAVLHPAAAALSAAGCAAAAVVAVVLALRRPRTALVVLALCFAVAGGVAAQVGVAQTERSAVAAFVGTGGRSVVVTAEVTGRSDRSGAGDMWFDAVAHTIDRGDRALRAAVPVRVGVARSAAHGGGPALGATLRTRAVAFAPHAGERAVLILRVEDAPELVGPPGGLWAVLAGLRGDLAASAARRTGPGASLVPGLTLGDTSAVTPELEESMRASSLTHLTAVSGANCAVVVGLAFAVAAGLGARRWVRVAAGLGALALFVLLVTPEPSVVRAAAMATIAMLAVALGRTGAGIAVLSVAVIVLLVIDPWLSLSLGFALSAAATASLLVLARPLGAGLARVLPAPLALAIAVPLAAQLACGPLLILVDPHVPVLAVAANLLAGPAAPAATVIGLAACLAAPVPALQDLLVGLAWVPASWIAAVAGTVGALPGQRLEWWDGILGALLLTGLGAAVVILLHPPPRTAARAWTVVRSGAGIALAVAGSIGAGQVLLVGVAAPLTVPSAWQIVVCDVGQGDALLIRDRDVVALVDTGPAPAPLAECLRRFGVGEVDLLVLTHFDADHAGGVGAVVGRVGQVLHGPADADGARTLSRLERAGARLSAGSAGMGGGLGGARWRVLWPPASERQPGNGASIALRVDGGALPSIVLLGDLPAEAQMRLRGASDPAPAQIVKVAHHGSADQDDGLYEDVHADLALIPVGAQNDYGHPRDSLLALLRRLGSQVARSDRDGDIAVWREGSLVRVWRENGVAGAD